MKILRRDNRWVPSSDWSFWLIGVLYAATCWLAVHSLLDAMSVHDVVGMSSRSVVSQLDEGGGVDGEAVAHSFKTRIYLGRGNSWAH
ncbi:MAG: hypothetical protein F8N37_01735 [Telmatospirillum sp.]|nr:hypothetical protein [Telmatospirillum sp.]